FSWDDNSTENNAKRTDRAMLLVYNPMKNESTYQLAGADRITGTDVLVIPNTYAGDTVELFMAFVALDGKVSNSSYLGSGTAA
ncbi:MAG: DUF6266 family protein, partial [Lutibacter sp.]